jgi:hypothetical protein
MKRVAATALLAMGLLNVGAADEPKDASAAGARAAADQARAEVAKQLRAQASEFTVVTVEPAQWSDSSLGCRKQNSMYRQVMINGYVVVLERQGTRLQVNVAGTRAVMCEPTTRLGGTVRGPMPARGLDRVSTLARQDLSASGRTYFYHTDLRSVRACPPNATQ